MKSREIRGRVDLDISSTSAGRRVRIWRAAKDLDSGTVLSVVHRNILYVDVGDDIGYSSILQGRVR